MAIGKMKGVFDKGIFRNAIENLSFKDSLKFADDKMALRISKNTDEAMKITEKLGGLAGTEDEIIKGISDLGIRNVKDVSGNVIKDPKKYGAYEYLSAALDHNAQTQTKLAGQKASLEAGKRRAVIKERGDYANYGANAVGNYFFGSGLKKGAIRTGAVAGVGFTGAIGARLATGGTMTRTNSGQKDLAGVPWI